VDPQRALAHMRLAPGWSHLETILPLREGQGVPHTAAGPVGHFGNSEWSGPPGEPSEFRPPVAGDQALITLGIRRAAFSKTSYFVPRSVALPPGDTPPAEFEGDPRPSALKLESNKTSLGGSQCEPGTFGTSVSLAFERRVGDTSMQGHPVNPGIRERAGDE
jgi:hypothetical protein